MPKSRWSQTMSRSAPCMTCHSKPADLDQSLSELVNLTNHWRLFCNFSGDPSFEISDLRERTVLNTSIQVTRVSTYTSFPPVKAGYYLYSPIEFNAACQISNRGRIHNSRIYFFRNGITKVLWSELQINPQQRFFASTFLMAGSAKMSPRQGPISLRRSRVSTIKSSSRVDTCMRQTKPWYER